jgi:hypothetical protein
MSFNRLNIKLALPALVYFVFVAFAVAQKNGKSPIAVFKSESGYVYSDNSPGLHYTMEFIGDSIQPVNADINAFNVGKKLYQILNHDYTSKQYTNKSDPSKEEALLLYFKKYEADYQSQEIHNQELKISEEFFTNSDEKKFHLWYFPQPDFIEGGYLSKEAHESTTWHVNLAFIANQKVVVIYSPILANRMSIEEKISDLKAVAESVNIFGGSIDEAAFSYKLNAAKDGKLIEYADPRTKYYVDIPEWLNVTESSRAGFLLGTLPDINNVKNAISIEWFEKSEFKSIEDFNTAQVLQYKMGDVINGTQTFMLRNEYKDKAENQGLSYKVQLMAGNSLYNTHVVTYETSSGYLLCRFVATQETYKRNLPKFFEFVNSIVLE